MGSHCGVCNEGHALTYSFMKPPSCGIVAVSAQGCAFLGQRLAHLHVCPQRSARAWHRVGVEWLVESSGLSCVISLPFTKLNFSSLVSAQRDSFARKHQMNPSVAGTNPETPVTSLRLISHIWTRLNLNSWHFEPTCRT